MASLENGLGPLVDALNAIDGEPIALEESNWLARWMEAEPTRKLVSQSDDPLQLIRSDEYVQRASAARSVKILDLPNCAEVTIHRRGLRLGAIYVAFVSGLLRWSNLAPTAIATTCSVDASSVVDPVTRRVDLNRVAGTGDAVWAQALVLWSRQPKVALGLAEIFAQI